MFNKIPCMLQKLEKSAETKRSQGNSRTEKTQHTRWECSGRVNQIIIEEKSKRNFKRGQQLAGYQGRLRKDCHKFKASWSN